VEIERKFLVDRLPDMSEVEAAAIEQGYLALGEDEVRVRRAEGRGVLTVKRGGGLAREEAEVELNDDQLQSLWPLTEGRRLRKRRHLLPVDGLTAEVDVYEGDLEGLIVAEVEFDSERSARAFEAPEWLGREVTGDPAYLNERLATHGLPGP
jgi:CYTH domain-containing protein